MILYIGNKLLSKHKNVTGVVTLGKLLKLEGYNLISVSSKENQVLRLISMFWTVLRYSKKTQYVLIDTYSTRNFYYALIISQSCRLLRLKYIPILHGGNLPERLVSSPKFSHLIFENSYINVAPSNYLKIEFEQKEYKTRYIPNVLEIDHIVFEERVIETPKILFVRAFATIYNPEMAIRVLMEVKKRYPDAKLCMIGPVKDASFDDCKLLVKTLNLESNVEFTGKLSKEEWHKKSEEFNIFINTTNVDNTPVSVIEAMALGLPVVSTNVGGIPYLIENKTEGLLVERNNPKDMANAIKQLCQNQKLSHTLAFNARKKAEQFDWETVKPLWLEILK